MIHRRIAALFLVLSLAQMPLTRTFGVADYAAAACKNSLSAMGAHARQHPILVTFLSACTLVCIGFLWKKRNEILEERLQNQLEYYRIRNLSRNVREAESKDDVSSNVPIEPTVIEATKSEVTTNEATTMPTAAEAIVSTDEPIEQKTLVTIEMTPLYDQSNGLYDAYLQ